MLLQEEQYIIKWLSQYRTLEIKQVKALLRDSAELFVDRALNRLRREGHIVYKDDRYISAEPTLSIDQRMLDALWVMIRFSDNIDPMAHYPAQYPAQIIFIKEQAIYEIIVLYRDELHHARLLEDDDVKYIIVIPDIALAENIKLPEAPCMFATITRSENDEAQAKFYTRRQ